MTTLNPTPRFLPRPLVAPLAGGLVGALLLMIGGLLVADLILSWLLIGGGLAALLATGAWVVRRLERERATLSRRFSEQDRETLLLQADYTTLERAFDELQSAYGTLERRIDQRTVERDQQTSLLQQLLDDSRSHAAQLAALNEVAAVLNATLDRNEVLACILRQLERVVVFDSASVQLLEQGELKVLATRGMGADGYDERIRLADNALARRVIEAPVPIVLDDVRHEQAFLQRHAPVRAWIGAALRVGDRTVGMLTVDSYECATYTEADARLVASFATQAALALHNAHLYAEAERRASEMTLLLEMTRTVGSTLHLPEVLLRAAAAVGAALHADDVRILLLDESGTELIPQAGVTGQTSYLRQRWPVPTLLSAEPALAKVISQGCARVMHIVSPILPYSGLLALPLSIKDQVLGVVLVATPDSDVVWGPQQLVLAEGLATSAALAIEHARLYDQARRAAQIEERSRLARELHDSVTQTLFSMTLTAEAARTQIERNPVRAAAQIDRLRIAAHQSLGEMRELLLQLRPTPLQEHGLIRALRDHIATLNAHDVHITVEVTGDDRNLHQYANALYRIAQEAIANALRHAQAQAIMVRLDLQLDALELEVRDNGCGFDPVTFERGGRQLGLTSMAERAAEVGGIFEMDSRPGAGTTLRVRIAG